MNAAGGQHYQTRTLESRRVHLTFLTLFQEKADNDLLRSVICGAASGANFVEDSSGRLLYLERLSELKRRGVAARLLSTPGQKVSEPFLGQQINEPLRVA